MDVGSATANASDAVFDMFWYRSLEVATLLVESVLCFHISTEDLLDKAEIPRENTALVQRYSVMYEVNSTDLSFVRASPCVGSATVWLRSNDRRTQRRYLECPYSVQQSTWLPALMC